MCVLAAPPGPAESVDFSTFISRLGTLLTMRPTDNGAGGSGAAGQWSGRQQQLNSGVTPPGPAESIDFSTFISSLGTLLTKRPTDNRDEAGGSGASGQCSGQQQRRNSGVRAGQQRQGMRY